MKNFSYLDQSKRSNVIFVQFCIDCHVYLRGESYLANAEGGRVCCKCLQKEADDIFGKCY